MSLRVDVVSSATTTSDEDAKDFVRNRLDSARCVRDRSGDFANSKRRTALGKIVRLRGCNVALEVRVLEVSSRAELRYLHVDSINPIRKISRDFPTLVMWNVLGLFGPLGPLGPYIIAAYPSELQVPLQSFLPYQNRIQSINPHKYQYRNIDQLIKTRPCFQVPRSFFSRLVVQLSQPPPTMPQHFGFAMRTIVSEVGLVLMHELSLIDASRYMTSLSQLTLLFSIAVRATGRTGAADCSSFFRTTVTPAVV